MLITGILEQVGAAIGTTAALRLAGWQDGAPVYIPDNPTPTHKLCAVLDPDDADTGFELLVRLCAAFGGETIRLPQCAELDFMRRRGIICRHLKRGVSVRCIAHDLGMSEKQVARHRRWLESAGLLPVVFRPDATDAQMPLALDMRVQAQK